MNRAIISILSLAILLSACRSDDSLSQSWSATLQQQSSPVNMPRPYLVNRVSALLSKMSMAEKIGQMTQVEVSSMQPPEDVSLYYIGSILRAASVSRDQRTPESWAASFKRFQDEAMRTRLKIPIIFGVDAVHGNGDLEGATIFPHQIGLGATRDAELIRQIGQATAEEMLASGSQWNFAPVVAVTQDIRWGRTYESFGEDPNLVSELGSAYLEGLQTVPKDVTPAADQTLYVLATPKHFLGDGGTTFGTSTKESEAPYLLDQGDMRLEEVTIRSLFLPPYQVAVNNGAMSIMVSLSSWNGVRMHAQKYWITDVLKSELGFQGFVISDWAGMDQISSDYYTSIVAGINAGIDMNMVPFDYVRFIDTVKQAVQRGDIPEKRINDAVRRILTVKMELGLFDNPNGDPSPPVFVGTEPHNVLARTAVSESLVLLKNEPFTLPLAKGTPMIYVAGQGADDIGMQCGGWTNGWQGKSGNIRSGTTILQGIRDAVLPGSLVNYNIIGEFTNIAEVGIVVVGEKPYAEGMGDKANLDLAQVDIDAITNLRAHSRKLVVILLSGRPMIITKHLPLADAWVAAWLPGTEGAGVADNLFGDHPFTGKLSFTWPRSNDQLPIKKNNSNGLTGCAAPLFLYGYGLGEAGSQPVEWLECP
jgi:beta-glucosidase